MTTEDILAQLKECAREPVNLGEGDARTRDSLVRMRLVIPSMGIDQSIIVRTIDLDSIPNVKRKGVVGNVGPFFSAL